MSITIQKNKQLRTDIIRFLYYKRSLSIADLSKLAKKSLPLVASTVNGLVDEGQLIQQGLAPSTGGRRAVMYLLNPKCKKYVIGVAMDQLVTRLVIYNLANEIILPLQILELNLSANEDGVEKLIYFINRCIEISSINRTDLMGVGIGMPGFVNTDKGINQTYLQVTAGRNLQDYLSEKMKLSVFIDNDSSLIALAELHLGLAVDLKNVLVVNVGWGTGLGMIINGKLYRGSSGYAGEFSHIPLSKNNNLCSCGKRGCLEVDTSLLVMTVKAEQAVADGAESSLKNLFMDKTKHPGDHFLDAVVQQDPLAISILSEAAFQLGKGLAMLIHIMNPELIVVSGRVARAGKLILPAIQQAINEFCIPRISDKTTIKVSNLVEEAELLSAAGLVIANCQIG